MGDLFLAWTMSSKRSWMMLEPVVDEKEEEEEEEEEQRALSKRESRKDFCLR